MDTDVSPEITILDKDDKNSVEKNIVKEVIENAVERCLENFNKKTIFCNDPLIYTIDNCLTNEECDYFITLGKDKLERASVSSNEGGYVSKGRSGSNCWISHDLSEKTKEIGQKIANKVNHPLDNAEKFQIIRYDKTQEHKRRYDSWSHDYSEKSLKYVKYGGFRLLTALCYLNDVEEGGGTNFPRLNLTVEAKKGRIVVFENTLKNSNKKHIMSEHAGMPVLKGEKYAFNLWFRECPIKMLYKNFNPEYYKKGKPIVRKRIEEKLKKAYNESKKNKGRNDVLRHYKLKETMSDNLELVKYIPNKINIKFKNDFITKKMKKEITNKLIFKKEKKRDSCWINKNDVPLLTKKLEKILGIPSMYFENYNAIQYESNSSHNNFFDSWDIMTEKGKLTSGKRGQRIFSCVIFLTEKIEYCFNKLMLTHNPEKNSLLIYKNTKNNSNQRMSEILKTIKNNSDNTGVLLNIYIREKSNNNNAIYDNEKFLDIEFKKSLNQEKNINLEIKEKEK